MRSPIIVFLVASLLGGCESEHEKKVHQMERQIASATQGDWRGGIPLDALLNAANLCHQHDELEGCTAVNNQLQDIATSLATCQADPRSALCQYAADAIGTHPISKSLPKANALSLPENPFYWSLPTAALNALSSGHGYRIETLEWWWSSWRTSIYWSFAVLALIGVAWTCWPTPPPSILESKTSAEQQHASEARQKKRDLIRAQQERAEAEQRAQLARNAEIAKQKQMSAANLAAQQAAEAAAKLAAEKAQVQRLLDAALKNVSTPKSERRKHATSPK